MKTKAMLYLKCMSDQILHITCIILLFCISSKNNCILYFQANYNTNLANTSHDFTKNESKT